MKTSIVCGPPTIVAGTTGELPRRGGGPTWISFRGSRHDSEESIRRPVTIEFSTLLSKGSLKRLSGACFVRGHAGARSVSRALYCRRPPRVTRMSLQWAATRVRGKSFLRETEARREPPSRTTPVAKHRKTSARFPRVRLEGAPRWPVVT